MFLKNNLKKEEKKKKKKKRGTIGKEALKGERSECAHWTREQSREKDQSNGSVDEQGQEGGSKTWRSYLLL